MVAKDLEDCAGSEGAADKYGGYDHIEMLSVMLECGYKYHKQFGKGDTRNWYELSQRDVRRRFTLSTDRIPFRIIETRASSQYPYLKVLSAEMEDYDRSKHVFTFLADKKEGNSITLARIQGVKLSYGTLDQNSCSRNSKEVESLFLTAQEILDWSYRGNLEDIL
jgi:hypothetical protein